LIGDHRLHELEVPDRGTALLCGRCVGDRFVERALCAAHCQCCHVDTATRKGCHGGPIADVAVTADQRFRSDTHVRESDFGCARTLLPHLGVFGPYGDTPSIGRHQENRDSGAGLGRGGGTREDHEEPGLGGVRDELLVAVDDPVVTVGLRRGFEAGGIGPGAGFGQRERRHHVAGRDVGQPPRLLFVSAEPNQYLACDSVVGAEHRPQCQGRVAEFHGDLGVLHQVEAKPTPVLRNGIPEQSHLGRLRPQIGRDGVGGHDLQLPRHDLGPHEDRDLLEDIAEHVVGDVGIAGVHETTIAQQITVSPIPNQSLCITLREIIRGGTTWTSTRSDLSLQSPRSCTSAVQPSGYTSRSHR